MFLRILAYSNALAPLVVIWTILLTMPKFPPVPEPTPTPPVRQAPPVYSAPYRPLVWRNDPQPTPTREEYERLVRKFSDTD